MQLSSAHYILIVMMVIAFAIVAPAADKQTLTGEVSDSACGTQHMQGSPVECTRICAGRGAKYTLVVGEKVYSLNTDDKALLTVLNEQAGKKVTITGRVTGVGVEVVSAVPAK